MPEFPRKDFRLHVGWRTIKTAVSAIWSTTFCPGPGSFPSGKGSKARSRKIVKSECFFRAPLRRGAFLLPSAVIQWAYYHFP